MGLFIDYKLELLLTNPNKADKLVEAFIQDSTIFDYKRNDVKKDIIFMLQDYCRIRQKTEPKKIYEKYPMKVLLMAIFGHRK